MRSDPEALRRIREKAGHTQASLAATCSGVSQQRISDLESDVENVRPTTAKILADALGVDIEDITLPDEAKAQVA